MGNRDQVRDKTNKKNTRPGFFENPYGLRICLTLLYRLQPLQCGEAYYSVYATNTTRFDEPFGAPIGNPDP